MPKYGWYSFTLALLLAAACNTAELTSGGGGGGDDDDGSSGSPNPAEDDDPNATPDGSTTPDGGGTTPTGGDDDDGAALPPKPVAVTMSHNVTIQVMPSDKGAAILAAIQGAQTSVHMTMYLLTDTKIISALGALKAAGKDVQVTLNKSFPGGSDDDSSPSADNTASFAALQKANVDVVYASPKFAYTHEKGVIIDGTSAIIMTMNLATTSPTSNREYIATDTDTDDVATMEKIFAADHALTDVTYSSKLVISPQTGNALGSPRDFLTSFINSATTSLDLEVQELDDYAIIDSIVARQQAGVKTQVIVSTVNTTTSETAAMARLKTNNVIVHVLSTPYLHAKAIVVDGTQTWVGSQNFTPTALDDNREVGVFTDAAAEVAKVKAQIDADYTATPAL